MRKEIRATGCLRRNSHLTSNTNSHVWISDRQLAEVFRAFTTSRQRHGSNVPGPLEAMRRASKRKNTSMAWVGTGGTSVDPAIVMSANPQAGWWKRSEVPTSQATPPRWFWPLLSSLKPTPLPPEGAVELVPPAGANVNGNLRQDLQDCHDYEALQTALKRADVNLRQQPKLCEIVMEHVFASEWKLGEISKILLEPDLNPPGSLNYVHFLKHYRMDALNDNDLGVIERTLVLGAELGLNDVAQVRVILKKLCWSAQHLETSGLVQSCLSLCIGLFRALDISQVQSRNDLGGEFCERLIHSINKCHFVPAKARLLWMLRSHSRHNQSYLAVQINVQWLDYLIERRSYAVQGLVDFLLGYSEQHLPSVLIGTTEQLVLLANKEKLDHLDEKQANCERDETLKHLSSSMRQAMPETIYEIGKTLAPPMHIPTEKFDRALIGTVNTTLPKSMPFEQVSHHSQSATVEDVLRPTRLELWFSLLNRLNVTISLEDTVRARSSLWWSYDDSMKITRSQRALLYCWTAVAMSQDHPDTSETLKRTDFGSALLSAIQNIPNPSTDDLLGRILITLNDLPLPAKDQLLAHLKDFTSGAIVASGKYHHLRKELQGLTDGEFAFLSRADSYRSLKTNFPQALKEMSETVNSDLERFERLALQIIRCNAPACFVVQRILMHNQQLKVTLAKAWSAFRGPERKVLPAEVDRELSTTYSSKRAVELIHNIATEFALSPVLNARQALRGVYFCYLFLHHHHSPILPSLTQALWHAAITRRNGATSIKLVQWLVALITRLESREVAKELLLSSSSRRIRSLKLENLQRNSKNNPIESNQEVSELRNMDIKDSTVNPIG